MSLDLEHLAKELSARMKGAVETGRPLARFTTYRLGGPAALYAEPAGTEDLESLGTVLAEFGAGPDVLPVLALGRGSNLVISDRGWPGLVIRLGPGFTWISQDADDELSAGAAKPLPLVANWAARRSLGGLEWGVGVPGSVGGAVRMNAGAHGGDIASSLVSARVFNLDELALTSRGVEQLGFSYRRSNLSERNVVVDARLRLVRDDSAAIKKRMDDYRQHRASTQPGALQNAGSTFKNPEGDSAGRLVEAAGLKGFVVGGASVSQVHANFFMASDGARAQDVFDLVNEVRRRVRESFGVVLEPEVRFVGPFEESKVGR